MNKKLLKYEIIGFIVTGIAGSLLHFVYNWLGQNSFVGLFVPVNESPWEHLKLIVLPVFLYAIYEQIELSNNKFNVYFAKYIGMLAGIITILAIYYISLGVTGKKISIVNIISYFIGIGVAYFVSYKIIKSSVGKGMLNTLGFLMMVGTIVLFMFFTKFPIHIPLFQDPQELYYGIKNS